ncbi:MAG: hypothetical protein IJY92_03450 [Alphaproteobacteria bacterium]|nr:hypothetical protein [Alphaproteobacteria bacterium]
MTDKNKRTVEDVVKDEELAEEIVNADLSLKKDEKASEEALLINQQALQSQYIEKLEKLLLKEDVTEQDVQNVEFCKAELLAQFLTASSFSSSLQNSDSRKKAADVLSSHLGKLYSKTAKIKEKLAQKASLELLDRDVREMKFGSGKPTTVVTDEMLQGRDLKRVCFLLAGGLSALVANPVLCEAVTNPNAKTRSKALAVAKAQSSAEKSGSDGTLFSMLTDLVNNPEKRLNAQLPDLLGEFNRKIGDDDKNQFFGWADKLVTGLSNLGGKASMLNALQGKGLSKVMGNLLGSKDIA